MSYGDPSVTGQGDWSTHGRSAASPGEELPDEQLRQDVCDRLMQLGPAECTTIDVDVAQGVVRLGGVLGTADQVRRAEEVVRSVTGVRDVDNKLRVG